MAGAIGKSTEVMKAMQDLIKVPEISQAMMELSKEMTKVEHCWLICSSIQKAKHRLEW